MPAETTAIHLIRSSSFVRGFLLGPDSGFDSCALNPLDMVFPLGSGTIRTDEHTTALVLQQMSVGPSANLELLITQSAVLMACIAAGLKFPPSGLLVTRPWSTVNDNEASRKPTIGIEFARRRPSSLFGKDLSIADFAGVGTADRRSQRF